MKILRVYVTASRSKDTYTFYDFAYNNLWMEMTYESGNPLNTLRVHSSSNNSNKLLENFLWNRGTLSRSTRL